jgi:hypothetical protein
MFVQRPSILAVNEGQFFDTVSEPMKPLHLNALIVLNHYFNAAQKQTFWYFWCKLFVKNELRVRKNLLANVTVDQF